MAMKTNAPERRIYTVMLDLPNGMRIAGAHRKKNEPVRLTVEEARHLVLEGIVEEGEPASKQKPAPLERPAEPEQLFGQVAQEHQATQEH